MINLSIQVNILQSILQYFFFLLKKRNAGMVKMSGGVNVQNTCESLLIRINSRNVQDIHPKNSIVVLLKTNFKRFNL